MGVALFMKDAEGLFNFRVNPCLAPVICRFRANGDHVGKCAIRSHLEAVGPDGLAQRPRHTKTVKRKNGPRFRFYPERLRIVACIGHGENSRGVSLHQQFDVNRH